MTGFWGYNEGTNEPPLTRDSLRGEPSIAPLWQRAVGAVIFASVVFIVALIAKIIWG